MYCFQFSVLNSLLILFHQKLINLNLTDYHPLLSLSPSISRNQTQGEQRRHRGEFSTPPHRCLFSPGFFSFAYCINPIQGDLESPLDE